MNALSVSHIFHYVKGTVDHIHQAPVQDNKDTPKYVRYVKQFLMEDTQSKIHIFALLPGVILENLYHSRQDRELIKLQPAASLA